jgi:hypothetical protein
MKSIAKTNEQFGMAFECSLEPLQVIRQPKIVRIKECDEICFNMTEASITGCGNAVIALLLQN